MAFGKGSTIVPSTSIASSFGVSVLAALSGSFLAREGRRPPRRAMVYITPLIRLGHRFLFRPISLGFRMFTEPTEGQDLRTVLGHGYRVLEVRCEFTICGDNCPAVLEDLDLVVALGDHRFDGQNQARTELDARPGLPVVRHLGLLVHRGSDPMPDQLADDAKTVCLGVILHRGTDVA